MRDKSSLEIATEQAIELLRRYDKMEAENRQSFTRAYHIAKQHLEKGLGPFDDWKKDEQLEAASSLMEKARNASGVEPDAAMGIALLSLFFQINTQTGEKAVQLATDIEKWYRAAIESDLRNGR